MYRLFLVILFLCISACHNASDSSGNTSSGIRVNNDDNSAESTLSLNGSWKFNAFLGDGSNYRDVKPEASDIIIDNSDTDLLEVNGDWTLSKEAQRDSVLWGEDYLYHWFKELDKDINVKFYYPKLDTGYYEHFIYYPFGLGMQSTFTVVHDEGSATRYISQRSRPGQWISLGIFKLDSKNKPHILINSNSKSQVIADAVMLRPVDEQAYQQAVKDKQAAPSIATVDSNWQELKVPGHWGMINKYSTYTGKGWYRKTFQLPLNWKPESDDRLRLKFDGVYHIANVYLNGQYLGRHQGGFTPFEFDVTNHINIGGDNVIAVEADNNAIVGATWNWGGIIRDVNLIKGKDVRIVYQYIHAEPNLETGTAKIIQKVRVENSSDRVRSLDFLAKITKDTELEQLSHQVTVAANSTSEFTLQTSLSKSQVKLWHFDSPQLYHMQSTLSERGRIVHGREDRFGIRKIELTDSQLLLNGEAVRIGGYNRVSDHRYWGSSEALELLEQDINLMKNAGANFMRIMHGTQNKKLIELCDEKGILLFEEVNVRELANPEFIAPDYAINKQWLREMIERDINHPSIIGWSVGNELTDHFDYARKMIDYVKNELDPYRLVTNVSNTGYHDQDSPTNDPLGFSDLMMQNIYQKQPEKVVETISKRWPGKPLFISEYGLGRFNTESLDNDYPNFDAWHAMLRGSNTHVVGTSVWSFNDYRSGYGQTLESENRSWGLVNNWRQKRRAYATFQQGLSPIKNVEFTLNNSTKNKGVVSFDVRDLTDYPSYTMRDYQLQWQLRDSQGHVIEEHALELPTLTPDSGLWRGNVAWNTDIEEVYDINIRVLSSNGFIRYKLLHPLKVPEVPAISSVITGKNGIRVVFEKSHDDSEYFLRYTNVDGQLIQSEKTINHYIDINNAELNHSYTLKLFASNTMGESPASKSVTVKYSQEEVHGGVLPPIIWHDMVRDNKLIVGYSGDYEDQSYELAYGYHPEKLSLQVSTSGRGMLTANVNPDKKQVYYKLKRMTSGGISVWSEVRAITIK